MVLIVQEVVDCKLKYIENHISLVALRVHGIQWPTGARTIHLRIPSNVNKSYLIIAGMGLHGVCIIEVALCIGNGIVQCMHVINSKYS